ncbi:MAG: type II secretion system F family protein [Candidatus Omnitrophota bacterium]|nr:type II secretion system F family protein [Candidatus Omnitrophota bacterium]
MPKYNYTAKTKDSKTIRDVETASSKDEVINKLRSRGLFIVSVREIGEKKEIKASSSSTFSFFSLSLFSGQRRKRPSVKLQDLTFLARNLATTLSSGVTLLRSLEILASQTESGKLEQVLNDCSQNIRSGLSLSESIAKYPKVFSNLWQGIVEVGEASGNLPLVLERLSDYLEMRMDFERKVKSALVYPIILMFAAVGALFIFFKFILPKFFDIFQQMNVEVPAATQFIFNISKFLNNNLAVIVIGGVGSAVGFIFFTKNPQTKKIWDRIILKLPLVGGLVFLGALERLTSTIYILLESGLPLVYTLEVSSRGVGNTFLEKNIMAVKEKVRTGASLSDEFRKLNLFPMLISEMAKIGEETGSMPQVFKKIAAHYQRDLTVRVERLVSAFEPLIILFMGLIIGGMVISLFLPLFKLGSMGAAGG